MLPARMYRKMNNISIFGNKYVQYDSSNQIQKEINLKEKYFNFKNQHLESGITMRAYTLSEMKDVHIGKPGTPERDTYEYELRMDFLGDMIKTVRKARNLTQEELGNLVGVQKAQISKLESSVKNTSIDTILKVFRAMNAEINFNVKMDERQMQL
jgi:HTH-type transcriptional regulator / antitoxin HipB